LWFATNTLAQTTGTILGTVRDATSAVVPGVSVTATNTATTAARTVLSDEVGNYVIPLLPVGDYEVAAELTGFQKVIRKMTLEVDQRARVDIALSVGGVTEVASVTEEAPLVKADSSDIGTIVDNKRLTELPLNGRNFIALNELDAGAAARTGGRSAYFFTLFGGAYSINGSPGDSSTYSIDGIMEKGQGDARTTIKVTIDTIQEFKQQQSLYSAESGGGGGNVNLVTRSGSNAFHWSAWEFVRNSKFDARNFFDGNEVPPFRLNQYGGTMGGPIQRDKTFFFGSYEGTRRRKSVGQAFTVPTLAQRSGNFAGGPIIYDPATTRPDPARPGQFIRDPFPDNIIPANRIDSVASKALELQFPLPDRPGSTQNLYAPLTNIVHEDQFTVRIDHRFSDRNNVFTRFTLTDPRRIDTSYAQLPNFADYWNTRAQNVSISDTHVLSQRVVNEARFGFNRMFQYLVSTESRDIPALLGITGTQADIFPGPPTISITGLNRTASLSNTPNNRAEDTFQFADNLSYVIGKHSLGFGADIRKFRENGGTANSSRGSFTFTARFSTLPGVANTGDPMADFLLGYPTNASVAIGNGFTNVRQYHSSFYIKDDWKTTSKLTLNIGLRYEYVSPLTEVRDRIPSFDTLTGQLVKVGTNGLSRNLYKRDKNNFAPRFGFAYQPFGNTKTVLRGGYGVFYSAPLPYMGWSAGQSAPNLQRATAVSDPTVPNITFARAFPPELLSISPSITAIDRNLVTPYNQQWSLGLQRELLPDLVLDVSYFGNKGTKLISGSQKNINQAVPGPGPVAPRRPYPQYTSISLFFSDGLSIYHAMRNGLQKRFSHGVTFNISHVWSNMIETSGTNFLAESSSNTKRDVRNPRAERGHTVFDARHRFVASYVWDLPLGKGWLRDGWQVSGVTSLQGGTPVDVGMSTDNSNTGDGGSQDRPDLVGDVNHGPKTPQQWFNINAFARPPLYSFGSAGRNIITGPGMKTSDLSLSKNFKVQETGRMQLRWEVFNVFNHPNFDPPNTTFGTARFGQISSAEDARELQFGMKLVW
jgi:hypothetical protein